jgi:hypothetical protein
MACHRRDGRRLRCLRRPRTAGSSSGDGGATGRTPRVGECRGRHRAVGPRRLGAGGTVRPIPHDGDADVVVAAGGVRCGGEVPGRVSGFGAAGGPRRRTSSSTNRYRPSVQSRSVCGSPASNGPWQSTSTARSVPTARVTALRQRDAPASSAVSSPDPTASAMNEWSDVIWWMPDRIDAVRPAVPHVGDGVAATAAQHGDQRRPHPSRPGSAPASSNTAAFAAATASSRAVPASTEARSTSRAVRLATSPAEWPPMPSATATSSPPPGRPRPSRRPG